jgi:hypothetical protein
MVYDFESMLKPILSLNQFKKYQIDNNLYHNDKELFYVYNIYLEETLKYNKEQREKNV